MKPITKYNIFNFLTTFAKSLVEVFIPIILYNKGIEIKNIILFFMFCFAINIFMSLIMTRLGEKYGFRWLIFISSFLFMGMYIYLQTKDNLLTLAFLYSVNNTCYYLGKHNYAVKVIDNKKIGRGTGSFLIVMILATIPASFLGSLLIKNYSIWTVSIVVLIIYLLGTIPIFNIKTGIHKHDNIKKTMKQIPKKNFLYFAFTQFKSLFTLLYPLYVFIYVKSNFSYIGGLNAVIGLASILFIYFYAKKMDKNKKDYMLFAAIFLSLVLFFEINITSSIILLIASVFDGIATKLYESSITRDFYLIHKDYDRSCYFLISEIFNNGIKLILLFLVFILNFDLKWILTIFILGIFISGFIKYSEPKL